MALTRLRTPHRAFLTFVLAAGTAAVLAQTPAPGRETSAASVPSYALTQLMPVDPEVVVGTLAERPALLRARQREAGAAQSSCAWSSRRARCSKIADQQGLAHFVEHMQFEGTQHFPGTGHQQLPRRRSG